MELTHFEWKKEYSVNVELFDAQHQMLIKTIDDLYQAIAKGEGKEFLEKVFNNLNIYANKHFSDEEKYFKEFNYPEADTHIALHEKFKKDILEMEAKAVSEASSFEILFFLENWWVNHIMDVDKKYSDFFNKHGLK